MVDFDGALGACLVSMLLGVWVGAGMRSSSLQGRIQRLQALVDRGSREVTESSRELAAVRMKIQDMGSKLHRVERLAGFWRGPHESLPRDTLVVVLRDAGRVGNAAHPGSRSGRWLELTTTVADTFTCDFLSTGGVIGWVPAVEFLGLPEGVTYG